MSRRSRLVPSLALALALGLSACAYQGPTAFVERAYQRRDHSQRRLAVANLPYFQLRIRATKDFDDDFLREAEYRRWYQSDPARGSGRGPWYFREQYFHGEFSARAREAAAKKWRVRVLPQAPDLLALGPDRLWRIRQPVGKRTLEMEVPTDAALREQGIDADFLLVFERIIFDLGVVASPFVGMRPAGPTNPGGLAMQSGQSRALAAAGFYLIFDVRARKVVAAGRATGYAPYTFSIDRDDWYEAIDDLVRHVPAPF